MGLVIAHNVGNRSTLIARWTLESSSADFQFSGSLFDEGLSLHAFDFEDVPGLGQISPVLSNYPEYLDRVLVRAVGFLLGLSGFPVEHPLVNLNPGQPGFFHGLPSEFPCNFSLMGFEKQLQGLHLLVSLAHAVRSARQECTVVVERSRPLLTFVATSSAFAGDLYLSRVLRVFETHFSALIDEGHFPVQSER